MDVKHGSFYIKWGPEQDSSDAAAGGIDGGETLHISMPLPRHVLKKLLVVGAGAIAFLFCAWIVEGVLDHLGGQWGSAVQILLLAAIAGGIAVTAAFMYEAHKRTQQPVNVQPDSSLEKLREAQGFAVLNDVLLTMELLEPELEERLTLLGPALWEVPTNQRELVLDELTDALDEAKLALRVPAPQELGAVIDACRHELILASVACELLQVARVRSQSWVKTIQKAREKLDTGEYVTSLDDTGRKTACARIESGSWVSTTASCRQVIDSVASYLTPAGNTITSTSPVMRY